MSLKEVYSGLSPRQKALLDIVSLVLISASSAGAIVLVASMGWWLEIGLCFLAYAVFGMLHLFYQLKVQQHIREDQSHK